MITARGIHDRNVQIQWVYQRSTLDGRVIKRTTRTSDFYKQSKTVPANQPVDLFEILICFLRVKTHVSRTVRLVLRIKAHSIRYEEIT